MRAVKLLIRGGAGNVVSFAFVGKMSHSLAGAGYDRGLQSQKYKVDYWTGSVWKTFIPERTGSDGFGKFDLSNRYTSVKASNQLPATTDLLRIVISGSVSYTHLTLPTILLV